jgi:CBS domain-containing protein
MAAVLELNPSTDGEETVSVEWTPPLEHVTAAEMMTREVAAVTETATLREIAELLVARRISAVPVVNDAGKLVGMVSESDLIDEEKRRIRLPRTLLFGVFPILEDAVRQAYNDGEALTAADLMTRHPFTLPESAPAEAVAEEMVARKINHVPITRGECLVGIIARSDVLRAIQAGWKRASGRSR